MNIKTSLFFLLITAPLFGQQKEYTTEQKRITHLIDGTLLVPETQEAVPLAIIIQGSGPTDRNGNQPMMNNNSLKFLAEELSSQGIAVFRFDKRILKLMHDPGFLEQNISFDDLVTDVTAVINYFKNDERFSKTVLIGHSKGSLIGILAAQNNRADALISIAGAGQAIDRVIVDQIGRQAPQLKENAKNAFDEMRVNGFTDNYDVNLTAIFRHSVQPFMLSWMKYNPKEEIGKLDIPVLIINGSADLQVDENEAGILKEGSEKAQLLIIENMNHVLKEVDKNDYLDNGKSYNDPNRPVMPQLIDVITGFINSID